jgi:hypothetical protein
MVKRRVQTRLERKRTGPEEWLVVTRHPLSDDTTSEGKSSPDAMEHDGRDGYRYDLSPTCMAEVELEEPSLAELARVIKAGACINTFANLCRAEAWWSAMDTPEHGNMGQYVLYEIRLRLLRKQF